MNRQVILGVFRTQQKVEAFLLSSAILTIASLTIVNVLCRTFLGTSWASAEEVTQMLMILICFIGMSYAAGQARHIRMSAIFDALPHAGRRGMMITIAGSTSLLMLVLGGYACRYVLTVYELGAIYPATRVPYFAVYALAPLGFFLAALQFAMTAYKNVVQDQIHFSYLVPDPRSVASPSEKSQKNKANTDASRVEPSSTEPGETA